MTTAASPAAAAPAGRAYEMVSPAEKTANDVYPFTAITTGSSKASPDGEAVTYSSIGSFAGQPSAIFPQYVGRRTAAGWTTEPVSQPITPSEAALGAPGVLGFSTDLRSQVVRQLNPVLTADAQENTTNLYRRDAGAYSLLTPAGPSDPLALNMYMPAFAGASEDFEHVVFESTFPLTPEAPDAGRPNLYEVVDGQLRLVGVLPDGTPATGGSFAGPGAGAYEGGASGYNYTDRSVSDDGSRIAWTDAATGQLYLRVDGRDTIHVSRSQRAVPDPGGTQPARFQTATPDLGTIFFLSAEQLTDDATNTSFSEELYAYDVESGELTNISAGGTPTGTPDGVLGVLGAGDDGEDVYFVSTRSFDGAAQGAINIYHRDADGIDHIGAFATTSDPEARNWATNPTFGGGPKTSRVTPDGQTVVFRTSTRVTDYDNAGTQQIYRYSAGSGETVCVSCNTGQARSRSDASFDSTVTTASATLAPIYPRALADDGDQVFFNTTEALVDGDINGQQDVYMWEPSGVSLISTGRSTAASYFADASADGDDVFFVTRQQLTGWDVDQNLDMYDARVGGGLPEPADPPVPCEGSACQGPPGPGPSTDGPATDRDVGDGNADDPEIPDAEVRLSKPSARALRRAARTGRFSFAATSLTDGRVNVTVYTRFGKRWARTGTASYTATARKRRSVSVRLSRRARKWIARRGAVRLRIDVRHADAASGRSMQVVIRRARRASRRARSKASQVTVVDEQKDLR